MNSKIFRSIRLMIIIAICFLFVTTPSIYAIGSPPEFPSCLNPQGTVIANHSSGIHGVPGDSSIYTGSDIVYTVSPISLLQCLCETNGGGIQTDWWKISQMDSDQIETLKASGWTFVPDGSVWGLDPDPYMAKNMNYTCLGGGIGGGDPDNSSNSNSSTSNSGNSGTLTAAASGQVLGLASTGNIIIVYSLFILGGVFLILSLILNRIKFKSKK